MSRRLAVVISLALLVSGLAASSPCAQTNDEINSGIQLNFSTPGARSLGMGGAFLALADDATAAFANPAGLTNLIYGGSEISAEFRSWHFKAQFPDHGRYSGNLANVGVDTVEGVVQGENESAEQGLSFFSVGYVHSSGIAMALYRHRLADFSAAVETDGILLSGPSGEESRTSPISSTLGLDIVNYGLSAAWEKPLGKVGESSLSFGLGISYYTFELNALTERYAVEALTGNRENDRDTGGIYGPPDRLGDNVYSFQSQRGKDETWTGVVGVLWKIDPRRRWSLAAVYRHTASFGVESEFTFGPGAERQSSGAVRNGEPVDSLGGPSTFRVPQTWGLGLAYSEPDGSLRATLDLDFVRYSQLADDMVNLLLAAPGLEGFEIDDGVEVHLGAEYVFPLTNEGLIGAIRGGAWYDPSHKLHYTGSNPRLRARFPDGKDDFHLAAGFGLAISESFQIDVGADWANRSRTTSVSIVWFF